jgi:hypothetical protein
MIHWDFELSGWYRLLRHCTAIGSVSLGFNGATFLRKITESLAAWHNA